MFAKCAVLIKHISYRVIETLFQEKTNIYLPNRHCEAVFQSNRYNFHVTFDKSTK